GKPACERSPDKRYCQGCYDFLLAEAELDTGRGRPGWAPVMPQDATPASSGHLVAVQKAAQVSGQGGVVLKHAGGRPRKACKVSRVTAWRRKKEAEVRGMLA
ncbi:MAG: hypothetical protein HY670_12175, partial [Chloroflexi bacterium]|nr:hypothetical protein [Chloroflexota bacterium]